MTEPTTFDEALAAARSIADLKRAMALLTEPVKLDFCSLMVGQGESERIAKASGTTAEGLLRRLERIDRGAAATADRLNLTTDPAFHRALAAVLSNKESRP